MLYVAIIIPCVLFCYLSRKYANPYTLTFVFGKKGAGKTCYMVRQMHKHLSAGWNVYCDMPDVRIPGVRIITLDQLTTFRPEPHSLLCLDEVGISMDNRNFKSFPPGLRDFFKYARKLKCKIIINSQSFDVDKKVRDTVDSMILMQSIGGIFSIARPIHRSVTLTQPTAESESRIADVLKFSFIFSWKFYYLPSFFRYFDTLSMPVREEVEFTEVSGDDRYSRGPFYNTLLDLRDFVLFHASALKRRRQP